ncbi:MAG: hypothetical protein AAF098_19495 [Pseudomonadota bacterium]
MIITLDRDEMRDALVKAVQEKLSEGGRTEEPTAWIDNGDNTLDWDDLSFSIEIE